MRKEIRKSMLCVMVLVCLILMTGTGCGSTSVMGKETAEIFAMDTIMDLTVYGESASELLNEARQLVQKYEGLFSVNTRTSDVARLNQAAGKAEQVSPETYELIQKSIEISKETEGLFDISIYPLVRAWGFTKEEYRVPEPEELGRLLKKVDASKIQLEPDNRVMLPKGMEIDLGGIAKGYLSQKLMELFRKGGAQAAVVSLGGNVQTFGKKPDGTPFTVGITDPADGTSVLGTIRIGDKAVITSGSYQRYFEKDGKVYHHIIDKKTGAPAQSDLMSVTVIGEDGVTADSLATALFVMGKEKAVQYAASHPEIQLVLVDTKAQVWTSEGIEMEEKNES
ncbi:MAG: FAD:protein FMN transferase [Eubacterium sp.]|nr:FAD:protein FMN transferase [Eubacterium sp.]